MGARRGRGQAPQRRGVTAAPRIPAETDEIDLAELRDHETHQGVRGDGGTLLGVSITGLSLRGAVLAGCRLTGTILSDLELVDVVLRDCDLSGRSQRSPAATW